MTKTFLFLIASLIIFSCQQSKSSVNENTENNYVANKDLVAKEEEEPTYEFDNHRVVGYDFDYPIDYVEKDENFTSEYKTRTFEDEGEKYDSPYLEISDDYGKLFEIVFDKNAPKPLMDEFVIYSERLTNAQNIGVGNTLNEFFNVYKSAKINFSYFQDGFVWLENDNEGHQFIIEKPNDFFDRVKIHNDGLTTNIDRKVFSGEEKITSIRVFGIKS